MIVRLDLGHVVVLDDVLGTVASSAIAHQIGCSEFQPVNRVRWNKSWSFLDDGSPLQGPVVLGGVDTSDTEGSRQAHRHPTGTPFDLLMNLFLAPDGPLEPFIGRFASDWQQIAARPYIYGPGSALRWHDDGEKYKAAFTYYAHPHWALDWGGELLVAADLNPLGNETRSDSSESMLTDGIFVVPRPDRMVILRGRCLHRINPVSASAGDRPRMSLSGFLQNIVPASQA